MVLAGLLGRSVSSILHQLACDAYVRQPHREFQVLGKMWSGERLLVECEAGRFTAFLRIAGEVLGILASAPLFAWSTAQERPSPFDASCCFFLATLITFVLYVSSFSLHLNKSGEFAPHPNDGCSDANARRCCSFAGEVIAVVVGDMASLFEDANGQAMLNRLRPRL